MTKEELKRAVAEEELSDLITLRNELEDHLDLLSDEIRAIDERVIALRDKNPHLVNHIF